MLELRSLGRTDQLQIETVLSDGSCHFVTPPALDALLDSDRVVKFRRSDGWVTVGVDPIRVKRRGDDWLPYYGPERRVCH